jgi:hypothetical protein
MSKRSNPKNLYQASHQWAERPADQRFWTLGEARDACRSYADTAREVELAVRPGTIQPSGDDLIVRFGQGNDAQLTNWSFGQVARLVGAPADYLRGLSAPLAAQCIDAGLQNRTRANDEVKPVNALVHVNGQTVLRSLNSDAYARMWNWQVFERLIPMIEKGWRVPPARPALRGDANVRPATQDDVLRDRHGGGGLSVNVGDLIAPAGIYASDHDMFAFMVNEEFRIDDGSDGGLSRGFFCSNSEVGAGALKVTYFHYRHVCGNHIVWDAEDVLEINVRHVGQVDVRFDNELAAKMHDYLHASTEADRKRIAAAKRLVLGGTPEEVWETVYKIQRVSGITQKHITRAFELATEHDDIDGDPYTAWGMANGLTRLSQITPYAGERNLIDRYAGKVLALAS